MRLVVTDGVAWEREFICVVCLSVGQSVCHNHEPCKNDRTDRDAVWDVDSGGRGLKEPCIRWGPDPPCEWTFLRRETLSVRHMADWKSKINNSSTTDSELSRNAGTSAFQLQETVLKSDKIIMTYTYVYCVSLRTFWTPLMGLLLATQPTLYRPICVYKTVVPC